MYIEVMKVAEQLGEVTNEKCLYIYIYIDALDAWGCIFLCHVYWSPK